MSDVCKLWALKAVFCCLPVLHDKQFGKVTDPVSSHVGTRVGEDTWKQRSRRWVSPVPHSPLCHLTHGGRVQPCKLLDVIGGWCHWLLQDRFGFSLRTKELTWLRTSFSIGFGRLTKKGQMGHILVSVTAAHLCCAGGAPWVVHKWMGVAVSQ